MTTDSTHYRRCLKSTSLIGGSAFINILIGMVRTKFVAVLLGPVGVGLVGVYGSITGMVGTVTGMGIRTSGVRQIAEAYSKSDERVIARTVMTLRRTVWVTGLLGCLGMVVFAWPLAKVSFGNGNEAVHLGLLGSTIFFGAVAAGQSCLLQGTRRIGDLASVSIVGSLNGTLISLPCYYLWGVSGIVPSLILSALAGVATSWWFARRVPVLQIKLPWVETWQEARQLLHFGLPMMLAGLVGNLGVYLIRIILIREVGLEGVGIYSAAYGLSGMLANFVLEAMGADYYPRLTSVASDPERTRSEINAQAEIALLLATPGLALTLVFAPLVIAIFYSGRFDAAIEILRWFVFGIFGRVVSWPLGFLILAKGKGTLFFVSETLTTALHVGLVWGCTQAWGLRGTGIAFMLLYVVNTIWVYGVCVFLNGNIWTRNSIVHVAGLGGGLVVLGVVVSWVDNSVLRYVAGISISLTVSAYCLWRLFMRTGITRGTRVPRFTAAK